MDHIDHAVKLVGADHVGLGSDFDGATMPIGMEDVSKIPQLTEDMLRRGYNEDDIRKILGGNTLRVMAENDASAGNCNHRRRRARTLTSGLLSSDQTKELLEAPTKIQRSRTALIAPSSLFLLRQRRQKIKGLLR